MTRTAMDAVSQSDVYGMTVADVPVAYSGSDPIENPNVPLDAALNYDLYGPTSSAGVRVTEERSLTHPAVWQALTLIGGDVAKLALELTEIDRDGQKEKLVGTELYNLVRHKPNEEMTAFKFWRRMVTWRLLWNNAYAFILRRQMRPIALVPLLPDRTLAQRHPESGMLYFETEANGELWPMLPQDVIHLEGLSIDNIQGYDFIKAARDAIGLALAGMDFNASFFKNGGRVGGILEIPSSMTKTAADKLEQGFRRTYNNADAFKTVVLRDNAKFHAAQMNAEQSQVSESRAESVRDIARYFNIKPSKLGEDAGTSYSSKAEDNRDYLDSTLSHHMEDIRSECREKLLTNSQKGRGQTFTYDTSGLLGLDFKSTADAAAGLVAATIISPNEARSMINRNRRRDGTGDEFVNPNTTSGGTVDREAMAATFRSLIANRLHQQAEKLKEKAEARAKNHDQFSNWLGSTNFKNGKKQTSLALVDVVSAAGQMLNFDADDAIERMSARFQSEAGQILSVIASSTPADEWKTAIRDQLTEWAEHTLPEYVEGLGDEVAPDESR